MVAVTWRLHRTELIVLAASAVVIAVGTALYAGFAQQVRLTLGVDSCVPLPSGNVNCFELSRQWQQRVGPAFSGPVAYWAFPALVGSFLGGPLFARELERGTHRLAWTQGVSRVRWAAVTLGVALVAAAAAGTLLALVGDQTRHLMGLSGYRPWDTFDQRGPAFVSFFVFGVAAGAFFGAWRRQILAGMLFGLLAFGTMRAVTILELRPYYYEAPVAAPFVPPTFPASGGPLDPFFGRRTSAAPSDAWSLPADAVDDQGRAVSNERVQQLLDDFSRGGCRQNCDSVSYLLSQGVHQRERFQPADRFWRFQVTEAAIYLALSAAFAAGTLLLLQRRDA